MLEKGRYVLVTGKVAHRALEKIRDGLELGEDIGIRVLPCTVAALMTTKYIARKLRQRGALSEETIIIPGLCQGSLQEIREATGCQVLRGPRDMRNLAEFFNGKTQADAQTQISPSSLKILAEVVNAPRLTLQEIVALARQYRSEGADMIDLGGDVATPFPRLKETIRVLKGLGFRVSIDSHQREDILNANEAGVDLILSLSSENIELAKSLACPAVLIPDHGDDLKSFYRNVQKMQVWGKEFVLDPILPPLTMGLAEGIRRYVQVRRNFPDAPLLMGLGNVTELVDADSPGVNAVLVGIATELKIDYILTTEVAQRARGVVHEVSIARDLMHRASALGQVPKYLDERLLTIKDASVNCFSQAELREMQREIKDKNYRIFTGEQIYLFNRETFITGKTAQEILPLLRLPDAAHAFYLGQELYKAELAVALGKNYVQDAPLNWGYMNAYGTERGRKP